MKKPRVTICWGCYIVSELRALDDPCPHCDYVRAYRKRNEKLTDKRETDNARPRKSNSI